MKTIAVAGDFDDLRVHHARLLQEASRLGRVHVFLWSDASMRAAGRSTIKFPEAERLYLLRSLRYVHECTLVDRPFRPDALPEVAGLRPSAWLVPEDEDSPEKGAFCRRTGLEYRVLRKEDLGGYPDEAQVSAAAPVPRPRVIVTGCYDWLHSGHVRFFEEASAFGDLYVVVGHDANIRLLKGEGHPLFPEALRRYMVASVRFVREALVSTGHGWMDAAAEIARIEPDIYLVNEDGDNGEKRDFCRDRGLRYVVLKRVPRAGLPRRQSTDLRGF